MKKIVLLLFGAALIIIVFQSFSTKNTRERDGTEPGFTGSPGDGGKTCTHCHGGMNEFKPGWITSNVPATGFQPGKRYSITATNTLVGNDRFGFLISPQDLIGNLLGQLIVTDSTETKLIGDDKYITYRAAGVFGQDSKQWSFDWIAPEQDTVVFYGAFNSNHGGHKWLDNTVTSKLLLINEAIMNVSKPKPLTLKTYPNPAQDWIQLSVPHHTENIKVTIYGIDGSVKYHSEYTGNRIDVSLFSQGLYFVSISQSGVNYLGKFIKN